LAHEILKSTHIFDITFQINRFAHFQKPRECHIS
jgi:hypothetical protein